MSKQSQRYLDIMTIRASNGSTMSTESHQKLFIEPICVPNMNHLSVDDIEEAKDSCLFYPTGHKNRQMKLEIEATVRSLDPKVSTLSSSTLLEVKEAKTTAAKTSTRNISNVGTANPMTHSKTPLHYYTKKPSAEIKALLGKVRESEGKIVRTIAAKYH